MSESTAGTERRLLILASLGGAGKTTALQAFEDLGFFAVDNLPPSLWLLLARTAVARGENRVVIAVDARTERFLDEVGSGLSELFAAGFEPGIVYLTAEEPTLIRRYSFTRRSHPLSEGSLSSDIAREIQALEELRSRADVVLDTSHFSAAQLRDAISRQYGGGHAFRLQLLSFGFKRGTPLDADIVLDVRTMPNPYYDAELRSVAGTDARVASYVFNSTGLALFERLCDFIRDLTRLAADSGRKNYTVAIGCTGGQHRSVAVVERLRQELSGEFLVQGEHRDLPSALAEHTT